MKTYTCKLVVLLLITAAFVSCKKTRVSPKKPVPDLTIHTGHGRINQDFSMCPICGGYFVTFDSDTSVMYRSLRSLDKFGITSSSKFPVMATISWQQDTVIHSPSYITITSLKIDQ